MTDRGEQLRHAARARHDATAAKAAAALRSLARAHEPVTFGGVARRAGISRSWLYRQPELRHEIERLRTTSPIRSRTASAHPASDESNRQKIALYREELAMLKAENIALREQLARKFGAERAAALINSQ
jgi:hypothetical protein